MAKHADTDELTAPAEPLTPDDDTAASSRNGNSHITNGAESKIDSRRSTHRTMALTAVAISAILATPVGWLGYSSYQHQQRQSDWNTYLAVGKQAAVNLTTIDFNQAGTDVARILNSATGTFRDDFQKRSPSFIEALKQAKSKSQGTVTEAGVESIDGSTAQVAVAVQVTSTADGAPVGEPRGWRMRINVQKLQGDYKIANVQFVP